MHISAAADGRGGNSDGNVHLTPSFLALDRQSIVTLSSPTNFFQRATSALDLLGNVLRIAGLPGTTPCLMSVSRTSGISRI